MGVLLMRCDVCYFLAVNKFSAIQYRYATNACFPAFRNTTHNTTQLTTAAVPHNPSDRNGLRNFYRAMHYSAKRGIAIACRLSVRP